MNVDRAIEYVDFVTERHRIWERRQAGEPGPWTTDPVLATKKFTNVFRVLDHDSQWLLRNLLDGEPRDVLMRCFLFRHTGRVEAWNYLLAQLGAPTVSELETVREVFKEYRGAPKTVKRIPWTQSRATYTGPERDALVYPRSVFTGAYIVFPQSAATGTDKLDSIIDLTRRLFDPSSPTDIVPDFMRATTQAERFAVLRRNKGVADFSSMQVLTDWGYTTEDRENEFIVLGPGARRGIREIFGREAKGDLSTARGMLSDAMPMLNGRAPSLMDLQNTMCEFSKYVRGPGPNPYVAKHIPRPPVYPTNWGIS